MQENTEEIKGLAFLCNKEGTITKVLRNDVGVPFENIAGKLFVNLIDRENKAKAINFLVETKSKEAAFNYKLNFQTAEKYLTLSFIGIRIKQEEILIIGAKNEEEAIEFTNYLQQINNEQANIIRRLMKEKVHFQNRMENTREQSFDDLTKLNNELINLQRELAKKNSELEKLNETKNRFLGMAAHDLRSPLAIIQNYTEFLMDRAYGYLPEKQQKFLETIYSTSQFMLNLIEDLLDVSKIESGKLELNKEQFDLVLFAKNNIELNKPIASEKGILITLNHNIPEVNVYADRHKIEQVFNNLLTNAIKFSYPETTIHVDVSKKNNSVQVAIKDQGVGIDKNKLENLFEPFQKVSSSGTAGEKGTGLGLLIVKRIVEGHNGDIWVDSKPKKGSTFYFSLPVENKNDPGEDIDKNEKEPTYEWKNKTILIIEDDPVSLKFIEEILEPTGANILSHKTGRDGLSAFRENAKTDMILLDMSLPDVNGLEVIQKIRKTNAQIPVIIQTAHAMSGDKEKALEFGANDYITKPIDKNALFRIIRGYLT